MKDITSVEEMEDFVRDNTNFEQDLEISIVALATILKTENGAFIKNSKKMCKNFGGKKTDKNRCKFCPQAFTCVDSKFRESLIDEGINKKNSFVYEDEMNYMRSMLPKNNKFYLKGN